MPCFYIFAGMLYFIGSPLRVDVVEGCYVAIMKSRISSLESP